MSCEVSWARCGQHHGTVLRWRTLVVVGLLCLWTQDPVEEKERQEVSGGGALLICTPSGATAGEDIADTKGAENRPS